MVKELDLDLVLLHKEDIPQAVEVIKDCYQNTDQMEQLLVYFDLDMQVNMPDCTAYYKIIQNGKWVGVVNLAYVGKEARLIRCLAYRDPDISVSLFELLKQEHPEVMCWMIRDAADSSDFDYDWEDKKRIFWEANGFKFYSDARYNQYIKMMKPHDEVYLSDQYRFALLDGSMDGVSFRFFGIDQLDFYDGRLTNCRMTDINFSHALIYDTWMGESKLYNSSLEDSDFRFTHLDHTKFKECSFKGCMMQDCDLDGMTIDGINVQEAIKFYKEHEGEKTKIKK